MKDIVEMLQRLGFGDYEARAYIGLLKGGPMTGYELARASGVPRANVYDILPKLQERGAVVRAFDVSKLEHSNVPTSQGARYSAVPPSQLMPRLADRFNDDLAAAERALQDQAVTTAPDYSWNLEGYRAVVDHARTLVDAAQDGVLVALWPQEASLLAGNLSNAEGRGASVTTLCLAGCAQECGNCHGNIHRYRLSPEETGRWLVVSTDAAEMLAAEIDSDENAHGVRATHPLLVELAGWYVRNSIALATLVSDLGDRLPAMLSARAAGVLASLGHGGVAGGWLEQMRAALNRPPTLVTGNESAVMGQRTARKETPMGPEGR